MTKTIVFLDVDGVLNAVRRSLDGIGAETGWPQDSYQRQKVNGYTITWSRDLVARLNLLADQPGVEFRWLTTWLEDAPAMIAPALGLWGEDWLVVGDVEMQREARGFQKMSAYSTHSWWKFDAIREQIARLPADEDTQIVWVDDDLPIYMADVRNWKQKLGPHVSIVLVHPNTYFGLTVGQVELMETYAVRGKDVLLEEMLMRAAVEDEEGDEVGAQA